MEVPKWRAFEDLVCQIQSEFAGEAEIKRDDHILGIDSKTSRQIDISIRQRVGQYSLLIAIECKDYKRPVDVPVIEAFVTKVRDIRAHKGAVISSRGFTTSALEVARHHGIDTFRLVDTQSTDWRSYASLPVMLVRTGFGGFSLRFEDFAIMPASIMAADLPSLDLYESDKSKIGTVKELVATKWNNEEVLKEPGFHEIVLVRNGFIGSGPIIVGGTVVAIIHTTKDHYFGHVSIQTRGLRNEQDGGFLTRQITTDSISPGAIEKGEVSGWRKLENPGDIAVEPSLTIHYGDSICLEGHTWGENKLDSEKS